MTAHDNDLAALLARAAAGDTASFMTFYDLTSDVVHRYARAAATSGRYGDPGGADELTRAAYLRAWSCAARQARSGLSPLAWLLSVAAAARTGAGEDLQEARAS